MDLLSSSSDGLIAPHHVPLDFKPELEIKLEKIKPDGPQLHISEGEPSEDGYPAPWIWRLIDGKRDRVLDIEWQPLCGESGGIRMKRWEMSPGKERIQVDIEWTVRFLDEDGHEQISTRTLPVYTRLPYPDLDDPKADREMALRLDMVLRGYCMPVVGGLDPHQKDKEFWSHIGEIIETKLFCTQRTHKAEADGNWGEATVLYGATHNESHILCKIESKRQMIFDPPSSTWKLGAPISRDDDPDTPFVADASSALLFRHPSCGQKSRDLDTLRGMAPADISAGLIRQHGFPEKPEEYLDRLKKEIEDDQEQFGKMQEDFLAHRGWMSSAMHLSRPGLIPSEGFKEFLDESSAVSRLDGLRGGLTGYVIPGQQSYTYKLQQAQQAAAQTLQARDAKKAALDTEVDKGAAADVPTVNRLRQEYRALSEQHSQASSQLKKVEDIHRQHQQKYESELALMQTLHARMESNRAQLQSLVERNAADGGFGVHEAGEDVLKNKQKNEWLATLSNMNQQAASNNATVEAIIEMMGGAGLWDNERAQADYAEYVKRLEQYEQRYQELLTKAHQHTEAITKDDGGSHALWLQALGDLSADEHNVGLKDAAAQARKRHLDALELLHRDATAIAALKREAQAHLRTLDSIIPKDADVAVAPWQEPNDRREDLKAVIDDANKALPEIHQMLRLLTPPKQDKDAVLPAVYDDDDEGEELDAAGV